MKLILSSLMFAVFALFLIGSSGESDTSDEDKEKVKNAKGISVSAKALGAELKANSVNFMTKYKDKVLLVSGTVEGFSTGMTDDDVIVKIKAGSYKVIRCAMDKDQKSAVSKKSKGDQITIKGICTGESFGDPKLKGGRIVN